ncbi:hypothetical protein H5410_064080 [Solanum commersonii]|uniref:Uncharacterized protein n=1 Tax=Solanum commersonii TaxID=4109 RepID=A0A9J5W0C3_SOLCO|nr:hypothetical protein H5410_064080 [Solanum commersonii]
MEFLQIQNSNLSFAKILPGRLLGPYLWNQLALTAKTAHLKVKRSPEQNFDLIFARSLPGHPLRPYLWSQLALTAKTTHFQCQMIPRAGKPPFSQFSCAIVHGIVGDTEF